MAARVVHLGGIAPETPQQMAADAAEKALAAQASGVKKVVALGGVKPTISASQDAANLAADAAVGLKVTGTGTGAARADAAHVAAGVSSPTSGLTGGTDGFTAPEPAAAASSGSFFDNIPTKTLAIVGGGIALAGILALAFGGKRSDAPSVVAL